MSDISLKGVARKYGGLGSTFSVVSSIFRNVTGTRSLRSKLEDMARTQVSFSMSECIYGWTAAFEQTWTHIVVRIELNPDAGITAGTVTALQNTWQNGIENTWNGKWGASRSGELVCEFTFDVQWVNNGEHHNVRIRPGPAGSNMTTWDTSDTGAVAAHEVGHMLGHPDEYSSTTCPNRSPVRTGTIMDNNSNNVPSRLMTSFANRIGSNVVGI